jgi:sugar phosphate isomerase/epimerase
MKIGASTILYRDRPLNWALFDEFKQAGIESLELTDYHPEFSYTDDAGFMALELAMRDLSLHLNSLHIHLEQFDSDFDLATLDTAQQEKTLTAYQQAVDVMEILEGGILVTHHIQIPEPDAPHHEEKRSAFLANLRTVAQYAAPKDVSFALENTPHGYTREPTRLVQLIADVDEPNVGICIDVGHRNIVGDPVEALRISGKYLITLHLHDNHGEQDEHLPPERGNIDWNGVVETLGEIDYQGVFMHELSRSEDLATIRPNAERMLKRKDAEI